jgi:general secretion pathway protein C
MEWLLKRHFWIVHVAVIAACASLGGRAAAHLVTAAYLSPPPHHHRASHAPPAEKPHDKDGAVTLARNIFCSGCAPAKSTAPAADATDDGAPRATTLQLDLVSTMIVPADERWSMAIMRDLSTREKDPAMFHKGSTIAGAVVLKVTPRRVYLRNQGRVEYLDLEAPPPSAPTATATAAAPAPAGDPLFATLDRDVRCSGSSCRLARPLVDKLLANTAALASSVHAMPAIKDGRPAGFRLDAIRAGSLFAHLGLQNGDVLKAVNGAELTTPDAALSLYTKLRSASHLSLVVDRGGASQTIDYTID